MKDFYSGLQTLRSFDIRFGMCSFNINKFMLIRLVVFLLLSLAVFIDLRASFG
jgi:hypothetical protein